MAFRVTLVRAFSFEDFLGHIGTVLKGAIQWIVGKSCISREGRVWCYLLLATILEQLTVRLIVLRRGGRLVVRGVAWASFRAGSGSPQVLHSVSIVLKEFSRVVNAASLWKQLCHKAKAHVSMPMLSCLCPVLSFWGESAAKLMPSFCEPELGQSGAAVCTYSVHVIFYELA